MTLFLQQAAAVLIFLGALCALIYVMRHFDPDKIDPRDEDDDSDFWGG